MRFWVIPRGYFQDLGLRAGKFFSLRPACKATFVCQGTTEQLAEKVILRTRRDEKHPSGAKARRAFVVLSARLKSCPFKTDAMKRRSFHSHVARLQISVLILRYA
jgi:hypothetical protein